MVSDVIAILGDDMDGPHPRLQPLCCFLLFGHPLFGPKVQTFEYVFVEKHDHKDFMMTGVPEFPCNLWIGTRLSRMCEGYHNPKKDLAHVTSDELSLRLAGLVGYTWVLREVEQTIRDDIPSLMGMRATGFRDEVHIELGKRASRARASLAPAPFPPALLAALGMKTSDPEESGQAAASASTPGAQDDASASTPGAPLLTFLHSHEMFGDGDAFELVGQAEEAVEDLVGALEEEIAAVPNDLPTEADAERAGDGEVVDGEVGVRSTTREHSCRPPSPTTARVQHAVLYVFFAHRHCMTRDLHSSECSLVLDRRRVLRTFGTTLGSRFSRDLMRVRGDTRSLKMNPSTTVGISCFAKCRGGRRLVVLPVGISHIV